MNNDYCKVAEISAGCVRRGNNCLYVLEWEKLNKISASPEKNENNYTYSP